MRKKSLGKLFLYDCRKGFRENRFKWLIALFVMAFFIDGSVANCTVSTPEAGFLVYLTDFYRGIPEYILTDTSIFELPGSWFLYYGYLFFMVGFYPVTDLYGCGMKTLLAAESRGKWLLSKFMWIAFHVICYFGATLIIMTLWSMLRGNLTTPPDLFHNMYGIDLETIGWGRFWSIWVIVPVLTAISLAFLQFAVSILFHTITGYITSLTILVVSCYWMTPWLPGNYLMLLRSDLIVDNGVPCSIGIILSIAIIFCSLLTGFIAFRRKDIF